MKKQYVIFLILAIASIIFACSIRKLSDQTGDGQSGDGSDALEISENKSPSENDETPEEADTSAEEEEDETVVSENRDTPEAKEQKTDKPVIVEADILKDDFDSTLNWISRNAGKSIPLDLSGTVNYGGRSKTYSPSDDYKEIDEALDSYRLTRVAASARDSGAPLTVDLYRDNKYNIINKIVLTEYGSDGRIITGWYFKDRDIIYEYRIGTDLYGAGQAEKDYPLNEKRETELLNEGYLIYDTLKQVPGYARIYGYAGDEYGGTLANVYATIRSEAHAYEEQIQTNGDGYYEFYVPVNTEDYYNITFTYGDWQNGSINDISIVPGTTEYSCGEIFLAPPGQNVHDTDMYLMNINKKPSADLKEGEYEVVLEYNAFKASLKPLGLNREDGTLKTGFSLVINADEAENYKYYVIDSRNARTNNMSYDMSTCEAHVTVYDRNGIVASYLAPAAHAGVAWEVFEIREGRILPINNYFYDTPEDDSIFF